MTKIELVQKIGNEVCEECGPDADCGIDPSECARIKEAIDLLEEYAAGNGGRYTVGDTNEMQKDI